MLRFGRLQAAGYRLGGFRSLRYILKKTLPRVQGIKSQG
jgi:hypothetical protein